MVPNPQATYMPQAAMYATNPSAYGVGMAPLQQYSALPAYPGPNPYPVQVLDTASEQPDFGGLRAGHFAVSVIGLFFAPVYIIGFPIVFGLLRSKMRHLGIADTKPYSSKMRTFSGFGWTTWTLVFLGLLMVCSSSPLVSTRICNYSSGGYHGSHSCYHTLNVGAFISSILGGVLWGLGFIFNIVVIAYGGSWIKRRKFRHY